MSKPFKPKTSPESGSKKSAVKIYGDWEEVVTKALRKKKPRRRWKQTKQ